MTLSHPRKEEQIDINIRRPNFDCMDKGKLHAAETLKLRSFWLSSIFRGFPEIHRQSANRQNDHFADLPMFYNLLFYTFDIL